MAEEASSSNDPMWSVPKFYFTVTFASLEHPVPFMEVSGMDIESQIIEYRAGNDPRFSTSKMPGMVKSINVTLKKGVFNSDDAFWEWYGSVKMNTITRETVTIVLNDEMGSPIMTWVLNNAFPIKIGIVDEETTNNEILVETLELVHESITQSDKGSL
ncbi:phage tail protein [Patiriisocius hiemis]|uniref:Phage tail protein n=1 Tax=Patiriisocius hiemis TaxID=3075604 RepID=A0ABU2Y8Z2_9FLAO|nr:phage tail protein [Constantimarinum sp. W242]MDT0554649.1 phage tail protein [Constantimarinum sp. W242]